MTLDSIFEVWLDTTGLVFLIKYDLRILLRGPPTDPVDVTAGVAGLFGIQFRVEEEVCLPKEVSSYDTLDC